MSEAGSQYLLVIDHLSSNILSSVMRLRQSKEYKHLSVILATRKPDRYRKFLGQAVPVKILPTDFSDASEISALLKPYITDLCGVVCRGDKQVQFLRAVVPVVKEKVLVADGEALGAAINKQRMRQAFLGYAPEITPNYIEVSDASISTLRAVESALRYPVIIKPANLASSLLIQSCLDRTALKSSLQKTFNQLIDIYNREERMVRAQVIVEEYLEGAFYSIDAYVSELGRLYFCPPVGYVPAKQCGVDDFALYKRFIPAGLGKAQTEAAQDTVRKALTALRLTYTSAHVELVLTKAGWKIIEVGPRLGRFRHKMYSLSFGIDHSLNDVKLHLGISPEIPRKLKAYCAAYSIYPKWEGKLKTIHGIGTVSKLPEIVWIKTYASPGDDSLYAKNGGHALVEFVIASPDKTKYEKACELAERVSVEVE